MKKLILKILLFIIIFGSLFCGLSLLHEKCSTDIKANNFPSGFDDYTSGIESYQTGDFSLAMNCWLKASAQGYAPAERNIGDLFYLGKGVSKNYKEAMEWYGKASAKGDVPAEIIIGTFYENGEGVKKDFKEALKWYQKAAAQGNETAETKIGHFYDRGIGVTQNHQEAMKWYLKAAAHESDAQESMGELYENGFWGEGRKDYAKALEWYKKSADQGNEIAMQKYEELKNRMGK